MSAAPDPMPATPLGVDGSLLRFRSAAGDERLLSTADLFNHDTLVALFGGEAWLRRHFPGQNVLVTDRSGGGRYVPLGIDLLAAAQAIALRCVEAEEARQAAAARRARTIRARLRGWLDLIGGPGHA